MRGMMLEGARDWLLAVDRLSLSDKRRFRLRLKQKVRVMKQNTLVSQFGGMALPPTWLTECSAPSVPINIS